MPNYEAAGVVGHDIAPLNSFARACPTHINAATEPGYPELPNPRGQIAAASSTVSSGVNRSSR